MTNVERRLIRRRQIELMNFFYFTFKKNRAKRFDDSVFLLTPETLTKRITEIILKTTRIEYLLQGILETLSHHKAHSLLGQHFILSPDRALFWDEERLLVVLMLPVTVLVFGP